MTAQSARPSIRWPLTALVLGAVAVAFAPIFPKMAMQSSEIGTIATAFWRLTLAFPILLAVRFFVRDARSDRQASESRLRPRPALPWLMLPGLLFGLDLLTWHLSFPLTTAANATLLANLEVVIVGLVGWLILKERLRWPFPVGGMLALGGVAWLLWSGPATIEGRSPLVGDLLAVFTAVWYASYLLSIKRLRRSVATLTVIVWVSGVGAIVLFLAAVLRGESLVPDTGEAWLYLVLLALVPHCLGQGLIILSLAALPASLAAVTLLLQPVGAACWGWMILGESMNDGQIAAGGLVLVGIAMARLGSRA